MQRPFVRELASAEHAGSNAEMSSLCVSVEQKYRDVKQMWSSQDCDRKLKVRQAPIGLLYQSAVILLNFTKLIYRVGQTIETFGLYPPTLEEYILSL